MSRRRRARLRNLAIFNFALVALIIGGLIWAYSTFKPEEYDPDTLCLLDGETPPHTAIVIDKTDEYSSDEADMIAAAIRRTRDRLEIGERLTIFELDARGEFDPRGRFSLCNPGRGSQVNPLFNNPQMIEQRYFELFERPLESMLDDLVTPKEAPASPIMEAMARLAQTEAFSNRSPRRTMVIFSDMLQNSDIFSAYGGQNGMPERTPDARDVAKAVEDRFGRGLSGVDIEVRLIQRRGKSELQRGPLRDYWDDILGDLGVRTDWRDL